MVLGQDSTYGNIWGIGGHLKIKGTPNLGSCAKGKCSIAF